MIRAALLAVLAAAVALSVGACGQKGPLKLPDSKDPAKTNQPPPPQPPPPIAP